MNTNGLARHYHRLTPPERVPLILSAHCRKDETEHGRLIESAPCTRFDVPDYFGLIDGFFAMANFHLLRTLDLACLYWRSMALVCDTAVQNKDWHTGTVYLAQYLLLARGEGWQLVCKEYGLDPEALPTTLPGWNTANELRRILETVQVMQSKGLTREEMAKHMRQLPDAETLNLPTPEDVQAEYRAIAESHLATWQ